MAKKNETKEVRNDVIQKMIGLEQRMGMQFGNSLKYNQTDYYKELSDGEKKSFNCFVNSKKKGTVLKLFALALPLLLFGLMQIRLTGNVVYEVTGVSSLLLAVVFISLFVVVLAILLLAKVSKLSSESRLSSHISDAVVRMNN